MTNREAIERIKDHIDIHKINEKNAVYISDALDMAISALQAQQWIPCNPSELPRDKRLWVTHDNGECRYVNTVYWDMTEWTDNVSDVVAYMPYIAPEPYQEGE